MKRIVATTDLSANSRAGMRFAIQVAQAAKAQLVFLHIHQVLRASFWSDKEYNYFVGRNRDNLLKELVPFIKSVYRSMKLPATGYEVVVHHNFNTVEGIIEYARQNSCDYIVTSTRGAGTLRKIYGTNTSALISKSPLPVLCIPSSYRTRPVKSVLYASDLANYETELMRVVDFARPLGAKIEMLHLTYPYELIADKNMAEQALKQKAGYDIQLHYQTRNVEFSLLEQINTAIHTSKPSVLVMFTDQERSFFERVFLSSKAREFSFHASVPLLSFRKSTTAAAPKKPKQGKTKTSAR